MIAATLSSQAQVVAWICLGAGLLLLAAGVIYGFVVVFTTPTTPEQKAKQAKDKANAKEKVDELKAAALIPIRAAGLDGQTATAAEADTEQKAEDAKSAIEQIGAIVASLPEALRFPGLLILIGTVLVGVATVQFGGTSLF